MSRRHIATAVRLRIPLRAQVAFGVAGAIGIFLAVGARALDWNGTTVVVVGCALLTVLGSVGIPMVLLPREQAARMGKVYNVHRYRRPIGGANHGYVRIMTIRETEQDFTALGIDRAMGIWPEMNVSDAPYDEPWAQVDARNPSTAVFWVTTSRVDYRNSPSGRPVIVEAQNVVEKPSGMPPRERRAGEYVPLLEGV